MPKIKVMCNLTKEQHEYLKEWSKYHKISMSQFLRNVIDNDMYKILEKKNAKNIK